MNKKNYDFQKEVIEEMEKEEFNEILADVKDEQEFIEMYVRTRNMLIAISTLQFPWLITIISDYGIEGFDLQAGGYVDLRLIKGAFLFEKENMSSSDILRYKAYTHLLLDKMMKSKIPLNYVHDILKNTLNDFLDIVKKISKTNYMSKKREDLENTFFKELADTLYENMQKYNVIRENIITDEEIEELLK